VISNPTPSARKLRGFKARRHRGRGDGLFNLFKLRFGTQERAGSDHALIISENKRKRHNIPIPSGVWQWLGYVPVLIATIRRTFMFRE